MKKITFFFLLDVKNRLLSINESIFQIYIVLVILLVYPKLIEDTREIWGTLCFCEIDEQTDRMIQSAFSSLRYQMRYLLVFYTMSQRWLPHSHATRYLLQFYTLRYLLHFYTVRYILHFHPMRYLLHFHPMRYILHFHPMRYLLHLYSFIWYQLLLRYKTDR